jgi:peroxiredoxin Q/BCP
MNFLRFTSLLVFSALVLIATGSRAENPADFTVTGANRPDTFRLADARGKFVALHFLLKTECPFCLKHTLDYTTKAASVPGVVHVFLKPDSVADIQKWSHQLGADAMTIYRDPDAGLAKAFGVPNGYQFHGQTVHYPALVLLNAEGKEVFRHVGKSNRDRLSFDQFAAKVAELRKK